MALDQRLADRSVIVTFLMICIVIFVMDLHKRATRTDEQTKSTNNWIDRWSLLFLWLSLIRLLQLLVDTVPGLCLYTHTLYMPTVLLLYFVCGMYQISRFEYCFKHDYSKHYFLTLYMSVLLWLIYMISMLNLTTKVAFENEKEDCMFIALPIRKILFAFGIVWYIVVGGYINFVYIYKIRHLHLMLANSDDEQHIESNSTKIKLKRIHNYLYKVLFLILAIQITAVICGVILIIVETKQQKAVSSLQITLSMIFMYLQIEHNEKKYIALKQCFRKLFCFICMKRTKLIQGDNSSIHFKNVMENNSKNKAILMSQSGDKNESTTITVNITMNGDSNGSITKFTMDSNISASTAKENIVIEEKIEASI